MKMISTKLNISCRSTNLIGYIKDNGLSLKQCRHLCSFKCTNASFTRSCSNVLHYRKMNGNEFKNKTICSFSLCPTRGFCMHILPKNANVFGDLAGEKYERVEMNEEEEAEEEFTENEVCVPRRLKPSAGQYARMVKERVNKGDIDSAVEVLDLIKQNRDKPTVYLYNLLIRGFAVQGLVKSSFKLYNDMKKRALMPNAATYTSLINACACADNTKQALMYLEKLRIEFQMKNIVLNDTHYNAMVKAYGRHNKLLEAFEMVDEMRDKKLSTSETTMNSLLHAAVSDKDSGLRHALVVWHLMRAHRIRPSVLTYNLLLRCIRDCKFGNLKAGDVLISALENTKILIMESEKPDLLSSPPILSNLPIYFPQKTDKKEKNLEVQKETKPLADWNLDDILINNKLILFGGYQGILNAIDADNAKPDVKTMTFLVELVPNIAAMEDEIIKCAKARKIELDVDFYNIVMRKRSNRCEYDSAKEILYEMQRAGRQLNIMTFGILAMGCLKPKDGRELIEGMETAGFKPNTVIMGTLISNACHKHYFTYLADLLDYMYKNNINPNNRLYNHLEKFEEVMNKITTQKGNYDKVKMRDLKERYTAFHKKYLHWKEKMQDKEAERQKKKAYYMRK